MPVTLSISFSKESELNRVQETIKRLPWYREHKYSSSFARLPLGINESSSANEIATAISKEYDQQTFKEMETSILNQWESAADGFKKLQTVLGIKLRDNYKVILTKYGSGGSYDTATGTLFVNISPPRNVERIRVTIIHEIVHMAIQYLVDKYKVLHWRKERLVDLLLKRCFPTLHADQKIKEDVSMVDATFNKLFPNIEDVARIIGHEKIQ